MIIKDGTLIGDDLDSSVGIVTKSINEYYYTVLWNDFDDTIEVYYYILETNLKKGKLKVIYEP